MTEIAKVYYEFWSQFTGSAYDRNAVPASAQMPYITYDSIDNDTFITGIQSVILWVKTSGNSVVELNQLRSRIRKAIPHTGVTLDLPDGSGSVDLKRGTPFSQPYPQEEANIKAAYFNVEITPYYL